MPPVSSEYILALIAWSLAWKGFALWRAAKRDEKGWFIALLILGTAGILEAFYLFAFTGRKQPYHSTSKKSSKKK